MSELLTAMGTSQGWQRAGSEASMPCDIFWTALMRSAEGSPDLRESSSATLNLEFEIMRRLFARARKNSNPQEWKLMKKTGNT